MLPVRPTMYSGAHGEHTLIYLLYIGRGIVIYRGRGILLLPTLLYTPYMWVCTYYYIHTIYNYAHTIIYILYITMCCNIYKGMGAA